MKAQRAVVRGAGGPERLHIEEFQLPQAKAGQSVVRVEASGVAFGDAMRRRGYLAPPWAFTPGYDIVGTVVGGELDGRRVGYLLGPWVGFGGYASHVLAPNHQLVFLPDEVASTQAIALGLNYITAHQLVHRTLALSPNQTLLVHGAAGGMGTAVLDVARKAGVQTIGTASKGKHERVRALGCEPIDYRSEDFVELLRERPVDAVLDPLGGDSLPRSHQVLTAGGTLVTMGISSDIDKGWWAVIKGQLTAARLALTPGKRLRFYGIASTPWSTAAMCRDDWQHLIDHADDYEPTVGAVLPFADVRQAHELLDRSAVTGKIVLQHDSGAA